MKQYTTPFAELLAMKPEDILTLSGEDNQVQFDDEGHAPDSWF